MLGHFLFSSYALLALFVAARVTFCAKDLVDDGTRNQQHVAYGKGNLYVLDRCNHRVQRFDIK